MIGITNINKIVSQKSKASEAEVRRITTAFLAAIKQKLAEGKGVSFRDYFSLVRSKRAPKGVSKFCVRHSKSVDDYKKANKEKGISGFSKNPIWKSLMKGVKSCSDCKSQKQKIVKSTKLLTRVNCKMRGLEEITNQVAVKKKR